MDLKELDWELIRDIVLFKQNDISHLSNIVYDINIKGINTDDGNILVYYDMWSIEHKNNFGQSNSVRSAVKIDWSEYLVLVRQKKLKELGI